MLVNPFVQIMLLFALVTASGLLLTLCYDLVVKTLEEHATRHVTPTVIHTLPFSPREKVEAQPYNVLTVKLVKPVSSAPYRRAA